MIVGVSARNTWTPVLDPWVPLGRPLLGALIGLLSGTYPALRAASPRAGRSPARGHLTRACSKEDACEHSPLIITARHPRRRRSDACGGSGDAAAPRRQAAGRPVEDQLGLRPGRASSRGRAASRRRSRAACRPGLRVHPGRPVAQRAAVARHQPAQRRGLPAAVRLRHQHAVGPRPGRRRPQRAAAHGARAARTGAPTTAALWGENPGATFTEAVDSGNFTKLGGCTRQGDRSGLRRRRRSSRSCRAGSTSSRSGSSQDQRMVRAIESLVVVHEPGRVRATRSRTRSTATSSSRMERSSGRCRASSRPARAGEKPRPYDRGALSELQRDEVAIARARLHLRAEGHHAGRGRGLPAVRGSSSSKQNEGLIGRIRPAP